MASLIRQKGEISIGELKTHFPSVSEMTLRRDLEFLDQQGHVVRVHGGVKSIEAIIGLSEETYAKRSTENVDQKDGSPAKRWSLSNPTPPSF